MTRLSHNNFSGCLLGGAIGDALGAPIEFMSLDIIKNQFGLKGVTDIIEAYGKVGAITDDTQMTIFTAEGLLRNQTKIANNVLSSFVESTHTAYLRWLHTQGMVSQHPLFKSATQMSGNGMLIKNKLLFAVRAPGNTCLQSLCSDKIGTIDSSINSSKGCGCVMRTAPVGLMVRNPVIAFQVGCELAAITHGHPAGYLSAGFLSSVISYLINGLSLHHALDNSLDILNQWKESQYCVDLFVHAINIGTTQPGLVREVEEIGSGWVAEEAVAIAIYCSLSYENDFSKGVLLSINHGGDSDSTGSITGNILGAILGKKKIPGNWLAVIELGEEIEQISSDLLIGYQDSIEWAQKYPGT